MALGAVAYNSWEKDINLKVNQLVRGLVKNDLNLDVDLRFRKNEIILLIQYCDKYGIKEELYYQFEGLQDDFGDSFWDSKLIKSVSGVFKDIKKVLTHGFDKCENTNHTFC